MIALFLWLGLTAAAWAGELPLPEVTVEGEDLSRPTAMPTAKPTAVPPNQDVPLPLPDLAPRDVPQWQFRTEPVLLQMPEPPPPEPKSRLEAGLGAQHLLRLDDQREVAGLASRLHAELTGGPRWFRQELAAEAVLSVGDDQAGDRFSGATRLFQFGRNQTVFQGARVDLGWRGLLNTQLALAADNVMGQAGWGIRASVAGEAPLADSHELHWKAAGQLRQEARQWWGGQLEAADRMSWEGVTLKSGLGLEVLGEHFLPYPVVGFYWPFWADTQLTVESAATLKAPFLSLYHDRVTPLIRPDLLPEKGWGGLVRIDRRFSPTVTFGLGVLGQGVTDWIFWESLNTGWQPANSREIASRVGVTADVETIWSEFLRQAWRYRMHYGLIQNLRQGEHQLETALAWQWPDWPLNGELGVRMQAFDLESLRPLYLLLDGSVSYHVTERIAVTLRAENWSLASFEPNNGWWEPMQLLSAGVVARF